MPLKDGSYKGAHWATRKEILEMLKLKGELTSSQMAEALGVSTMAVRQHLQELEVDGDVHWSNRSLGVGRPTKFWSLQPQAERHFPDRHRDLMLDLLDSLKRTMGEEGMNALLDLRKDRQVESYSKRLESFSDAESCVVALAQARTDEGYMAEVEKGEDGALFLIENHCPICSAATSCTGLCDNELEVFRESLGDRLDVTREEHMLSGGRRCVYKIIDNSS